VCKLPVCLLGVTLLVTACGTPSAAAPTPVPATDRPPTPTSSDESVELVPITFANAKDVRLLKTLPIPDFAVSSLSQCSVAFSPDGKLLSGVCYKSIVPVWDVSTGRLLFTLAKSPVQVAHTVLDLLDGKPVKNLVTLPVELIRRKSCGCI
jgi:WD40 repeat protein